MKKSMIATLMIGAGALAASASLAKHHEGKEGEHADYKAKMEAKLAESFAATDTDGSGTISRAEYLAAKMAAAEKEWDSHTEFLGDDGEASLDEVKAYHAAKNEKKKAARKAKKEKKGDH